MTQYLTMGLACVPTVLNVHVNIYSTAFGYSTFL
jgi:hypothetical protein